MITADLVNHHHLMDTIERKEKNFHLVMRTLKIYSLNNFSMIMQQY